MEKEIMGVIPVKSQYAFTSIFGYSTHGVPGLEVKGLQNYGNILKEKMIYVTRSHHLKIPLNRYVICLEHQFQEKSLSWDELKWVELPILLLYWSLAGVLPLKVGQHCYCSGYFLTSGRVISMPLGHRLGEILSNREGHSSWIGQQCHTHFGEYFIDLDPLLASIGMGADQMDRVLANSV
jgi:hypothetical protein